MELKNSHVATYSAVGLFFLVAGIEHASMRLFSNGYVRGRYQVTQPWIDGFNGAFMTASILLEPIFGHFVDQHNISRKLLLVTNGFFILGNFILAIDVSIGLLIFGRLVAGVGSGISGSILGNILHSTGNDARLSLLVGVFTCRQIGLVIGSAIDKGQLLSDYHFGVGSSATFTSPGVTLAIIGVLAECFYSILYWDLPSLTVEEQLLEDEKLEMSGSVLSVRSYGATPVYHIRLPVVKTPWEQVVDKLKRRVGLFLKLEILTILLLIFTVTFSQSALEFSFTDMTLRFYNISDNLADGDAALTTIILASTALGIALLMKKVARDPLWLAAGLIFILISLAWLTGTVPEFMDHDRTTMLTTAFPILFALMGFPLCTLSSFSILSKLTPDVHQSFVQSVARMVDKIAFVLGISFCKGASYVLYAFFGFLLSFNFLTAIFIALLVRKFLLVDDKSVI